MAEIIRETQTSTGWEVEFRFDREFVRRGLWRSSVRTAAYPILFYTLLVAAMLFYYRDRGPRLFAAVGPFVALGYLFVGAMWVRRFYKLVDVVYRQYMIRSPSGVMKYRLDDASIEFTLDNSQSRYAYRDVSRVLRRPDVWMLEVGKGAWMLFPGNTSEEVRAFLTRSCENAGVAIR